ncbi:MAG: diguanylate cyclase domain-containing protein [Allorhizobium sp.]
MRALLASRGSTEIEILRQALQERDRFIAEQAAALAHSQKIFDRSADAARIGVWQCNLPDNTLEWTDMVYDMFDLPRGAPLVRETIVNCYATDSLIELSMRRSKAIEERNGFSMDAEIITGKGIHRWIRITATVECEQGIPVRIFGIKQDITDEKIMLDRTRYLAAFDVMTGLANRAEFQTRFAQFCAEHRHDLLPGALLLVDLDGFKALNDTYGHAAGDECLKETARRLQRVCQDAPLIARIGGDELAILINGGYERDAACTLAGTVVEALAQPGERLGSQMHLSASVGIAFLDGSQPSDLFKQADKALYAAKAAGRNTYAVYCAANAAPPHIRNIA